MRLHSEIARSWMHTAEVLEYLNTCTFVGGRE